MAATLSLLGLYEYDETIFDRLQLPEGVDKDVFIQNLLAETAEFEILYPNTTVLEYLIFQWSKKELAVWSKLLATTQYEYDPISNYNRKERWTNEGVSTGKVAGFNSERLVDSNGAETMVVREGYARGNIGVTTTQQMIEEERMVSQFNIIDHIIDNFKRRFCLLVY